MNGFSIKEAFNFALSVFSKNYFKIFFFSAVAVALELSLRILIFAVLNIFFPATSAENTTLLDDFRPLIYSVVYYGIPVLFYSLIFFFLSCGVKGAYDGGAFEIRNCFPPLKIVFKFLAGVVILIFPAFLSYLAFAAVTSEPVTIYFKDHGFLSILILIPILFLASGALITIMLFRYGFFYMELLEGYRLSDALRKSSYLTLGRRKKLYWFILIIIFLNIAGFILIAGSILTLPVSALAMLYVYNTFKEQHKKEELM